MGEDEGEARVLNQQQQSSTLVGSEGEGTAGRRGDATERGGWSREESEAVRQHWSGPDQKGVSEGQGEEVLREESRRPVFPAATGVMAVGRGGICMDRLTQVC